MCLSDSDAIDAQLLSGRSCSLQRSLDAIDAAVSIIRLDRRSRLRDLIFGRWGRAVDKKKLDISILLRHADVGVDDVERLLDLLDVAVHRRGQLRVLAPPYFLLDGDLVP